MVTVRLRGAPPATLGSTWISTYRKLAHYPGRQTLGVIKLNNGGAVWVVQSADAGTKLILR